jgi:DNA replication and repair protein RecF
VFKSGGIIMFLRRLCLEQYRNYKHIDLQIKNNVNIFLGSNAQGKTNLLESIYVLAMTKSHRTHQERELIHWDYEQAAISGEINKKYGDCKLSLSITNKGKKVKINGLEQKKISTYVGALNVIIFSPEDLEIVKGSPNKRRRFLDMEIGQVNSTYLYDLTQYNKVLIQKNNFLKNSYMSSKDSESMLSIWNEQLTQYGLNIIKKRNQFLKKLQKWVSYIHGEITQNNETIHIKYDTFIDMDENKDDSVLFEQYMVKLSELREQELRRGLTLLGPHLDDIIVTINNKDVRIFGSQGQQRTAALSLKLAEIDLIYEEIGEYPILLLDDVLSELDDNRQTQLIQSFQNKVQTFITTTSLKSVYLNKLDHAEIYNVDEGKLK